MKIVVRRRRMSRMMIGQRDDAEATSDACDNATQAESKKNCLLLAYH
jgi:hypothetical protein